MYTVGKVSPAGYIQFERAVYLSIYLYIYIYRYIYIYVYVYNDGLGVFNWLLMLCGLTLLWFFIFRIISDFQSDHETYLAAKKFWVAYSSIFSFSIWKHLYSPPIPPLLLLPYLKIPNSRHVCSIIPHRNSF